MVGLKVEFVIPFTPTQRSSGQDGGADQLDKAGQSILNLLHRAAGVAEENSRHALDMAQKLSHQLRIALRSWKLRSRRIRTALSEPSNGCTRSILRLKTVSCGKRSAVTERGDAIDARPWALNSPALALPLHSPGQSRAGRVLFVGLN